MYFACIYIYPNMYLMRAVKLTNYLLRLICALRFQEIIKKNNDFIHNFIIGLMKWKSQK